MFVAWVVPLVPLTILLSLGAIGRDTAWCWIPQDDKNWRIYCFWGPVALIWVFNCCCYYIVRKKLQEMLSFMEKAASRRILGYIFIFIIVSIPPLTNRIVEMVGPPQFVLFVCHSAFDPLIGFCNAVVYGWNKQLRNSLEKACCKKNQEYSVLSSSSHNYKSLNTEFITSQSSTSGDTENPDY